MGRQLLFSPGILFGILVVAIAPARAQQLLGPAANPSEFGISTAQERRDGARFRYAHVNAGALKHSSVSLNLFPDVSVTALEKSRGRQFHSETWTGEVAGHPMSSVVFAVDESGILFGKVEFDGQTFLIRRKSGLIYAVLEVLPKDAYDEDFDDGVPLPEEELDAQLGKVEAASACVASTSCSSKTIDVMVVYTAQARSALGGTAQSAQAAIAAAVAEMNAANANSGVTHTINLVYTDEVFYLESNNASTDLSRLSTNFDGYMDVVHTWREAYGADLVSLITDTGGCGIGYIQSTPTALSSSAAFSVVRDDCLTTNKSLAHEMGHNMGLHHDWYVNSNTTPCMWHHGYVNQEAFGGTSAQRWRTIMAYNNQCSDQGGFGCTRITYWSSPDNQYNGDPMGIAQNLSNPSDAVFGLNRTACQVADFRASVSTPDPPMSPTNLIATGVSESSIDVAWTDNATDETGYKVQRSSNGVSGWSDIATLATNAAAFSDSGLPQGSEYYYRTYAYRDGDQSEYSNVDSARTMLSYSDHIAAAESLRYGISSGEIAKTGANDGASEVFDEEVTGGWVANRTSRLDVMWRFDIPSGEASTFYANAWSPPSTDGDAFVMSYSTDGSTFSPMFELSETSDTGVYQTFDIGTPAGSSVWIRLEDTDRGRGNSVVDQVSVDHIYIRSQTSGDAPPPVAEVPSIHLGDLQIATAGKRRWTSTVVAVVHNGDHAPEGGAVVSGLWSEGDAGSCQTDDFGTCAIGSSWKPKVATVTFTVTSVSKTGTEYNDSKNDVGGAVTAIAPSELSKGDLAAEIPGQVELRQNYPNPFNPTTVIEYGLPEAGTVRVSVFNALGMEVKRLWDGAAEPGWHRATFDGSDLSSGIYFATVQTSAGSQVRTMLLAK